MSPASGSSKPAIRRSSVVLPHPEGPSTQTYSPAGNASPTPATACVAPKDFRTSTSSRIGEALGGMGVVGGDGPPGASIRGPDLAGHRGGDEHPAGGGAPLAAPPRHAS